MEEEVLEDLQGAATIITGLDGTAIMVISDQPSPSMAEMDSKALIFTA